MRLLLDTHAVLWAVTRPAQLSETVRVLLTDASNDVLVSTSSLWEMSIKHHLGKLAQAGPLLADFPAVAARLKAYVLPIEPSHAILAGQLDWSHRDPFDRMLAAQATLEHATLISCDQAFVSYALVERLW